MGADHIVGESWLQRQSNGKADRTNPIHQMIFSQVTVVYQLFYYMQTDVRSVSYLKNSS
ncbi:hypothetical protein EPYR_02568 [Erwinia pyrifoliae DSM 12163]|nr:hypothetical protein EPYR_02568 [Erwinia pyrifoliae DSM 12163]